MSGVPSRHVCSHCGAPSAVGELHCAACGRAWVEAAQIEQAEALTEAMVGVLHGDPYLRSASLLAYTLRSHVRGFLDDPRHPLSHALLRYLHALVLIGGPSSLRQLAPHAERVWVQPRSPVLARALRYVRERFAVELAAAAHGAAGTGDFKAWFRERIESAEADG